jgi:hypothetical protein
MNDRDQRIREIAYFLWLEEGRPDGQADRHWRTAETIFEAEDAKGELVEGEPPGDYITPLTSLTRAPSSEAPGK